MTPGTATPRPLFDDAWTIVRDFRLHSVGVEWSDEVPFVLVPGLGMSGAYFMPLARLLAEHRSVQIVDLPGFGGSSGPRHTLSMEGHAAWLGAWLKARDLDTCHMVAHSMGCQVAAHLAAKHPAQVRTLTVIAPTVDAAARRWITQFLRLARDLLKESPKVWGRALFDVLRAGLPRVWRTSCRMLDDPIETQLGRVVAPTLFLRGANDTITPESWLRAAAQFPSKAHWQTIPGGAHCVQFSRPAETAHAILTWVAAHQHRGP